MCSKTLSGKFVLRVGSDMHKKLLSYAERKNLSLNAACIDLLSQGLYPTASHSDLPFGLSWLISKDCPVSRHILGIIIYGSWARGESVESSDIDVLLVLEPSIRIERSLYSSIGNQDNIDERVSLMFTSLPEGKKDFGSLWFEVSLDGILIFDKNKVVASKLAEVRQCITSGSVIRKVSHGQGYWIYA